MLDFAYCSGMTQRRRYSFREYLNPRVLTMTVLGFSSGLPFLLVGNTFGFWLRDEGTSLKAIGFLSWVGIAAAAITQTLLSGPAQLGYGQIFWVCGAVAALAGVFVAWSRPRAMPEMLARWWTR